MKTKFVKLGLTLSLIHVLLTLASILFVFEKKMKRFDNPELPLGELEKIAALASSTLTQPVSSLWSLGLSQHLGVLEWGLFALNSCLWGYASAAVFTYGRRLGGLRYRDAP